MNTQLVSVLVLVYFVALFDKTRSFCAVQSEGLHADLTRAVVRSSDWLKRIYQDNETDYLRPYRAASIFTTLRIAGHKPPALLSNFKNGKNLNIEETLKNELEEVIDQHGNLSSIPTGRLALQILGVISICQDPENFHGYNLIAPLLAGFPNFKKTQGFTNYFQYSLAVIALYNAGQQIPGEVIEELIRGANRNVTFHSVDIDSLILTASSSIPKCTFETEVKKAKGKLVARLLSKQNLTTGAFGNQYSTALAIQALQAARVHTDSYFCDRAMRNILSYQDEEGSFGTILANIQVTPALLGESLISLKSYTCPTAPTPTPPPPPPKMITVHVQLVFDVTNLTRTKPVVSVNVTEGSTAKVVLDLAGTQNACYNATYTRYSFGHSVTSICGVASDWTKSYYWFIYINGKSSQYGVDGLKPNDGDIITFKYKKY